VDAITLLKADHRTVDDLFARYEKTGERAYAAKRRLVDRMIKELSVHAAIEEQIFYPAVKHVLEETEDQVLESLEEHHLVKIMLAEQERTDPKDERFDAKVTVLMENVRHHVKEEEDEMFPTVRKAVTAASLKELGERMREAKRTVPSRPHPHAPDEPPGNVIAGAGAMLLDGTKDAASSLMRRIAG
jgi:hemerythrin superfamily protein